LTISHILRESVDRYGPAMSEISAFWQELNEKNEQQLRSSGIANIKRTVALNYFTWVGTLSWRDDQFRHLVWKTRPADWPRILRDRPPPELPKKQWFYLCTFTRMLHLFAKRHDPLGLLDRLAEPAFGNPFRIFLDGKLISQDLANSVLELYSMLDDHRRSAGDRRREGISSSGLPIIQGQVPVAERASLRPVRFDDQHLVVPRDDSGTGRGIFRLHRSDVEEAVPEAMEMLAQSVG